MLRWLLSEVVPFPWDSRRDEILAALCRGVGCAVVLAVLLQERTASAELHGIRLMALWGLSAVVAVMIGNVAREATFELCILLSGWLGYTFRRTRCTIDGRIVHEIHYPDQTWRRYEHNHQGFSCEWTDPTGRCSRVDVQLPADRQPFRDGLVVRVAQAPRRRT